MSVDPQDIEELRRDMQIRVGLLAAYRDQLIEQGFTRDEAMPLVRDGARSLIWGQQGSSADE